MIQAMANKREMSRNKCERAGLDLGVNRKREHLIWSQLEGQQ